MCDSISKINFFLIGEHTYRKKNIRFHYQEKQNSEYIHIYKQTKLYRSPQQGEEKSKISYDRP